MQRIAALNRFSSFMANTTFKHTGNPQANKVAGRDTVTFGQAYQPCQLRNLTLEVYPTLQKNAQWAVATTPDKDGFYQVDLTNGTTTKTIGRIKPGNTPVKLFHGPGATCAIVSSPQTKLKYFAFPGAKVAMHDGTQVELFSDSNGNGQSVAASAAKQAQATQPVLQNTPSQTVTHQAMVLGAGIGSRILPATEETGYAKPALFLDDHNTVIGRIAKGLQKHGITQIAVNTSILRESVYDALKPIQGMSVHMIDEDRATGTAGSLWELLVNPHGKDFSKHLDPTKPLLIVMGDAVTTANFTKFIEAHQKNNAAMTMGAMAVPDEEVHNFGIIATDKSGEDGQSGKIQYFQEKPKAHETPHRLANTGFYILSPEVLKIIPEIYKELEAKGAPKDADGRLKEFDFSKHIWPALLERVNKGEVKDKDGKPMPMWAQVIEGFWTDIGNPREYLSTLREVYNGGIFPLKPGTKERFVGPKNEVYWPHTREKAEKEARISGHVLVTTHRNNHAH